jgi:WD40 repeat protein
MLVNSLGGFLFSALFFGLDLHGGSSAFVKTQDIRSCCFLNNEFLLTSSSKGEVAKWDLKTGALKKKLRIGNGAVTYLSTIHSGKQFLALVGNKQLVVFDFVKEKKISAIDLPFGAYQAVPGPKGKSAVISCFDNKVRVFDLANGKERGWLKANFASRKPEAADIAISADGKFIAVAFGPIRRHQERTHIWDAVTFKPLVDYGERYADKVTVAFNPTKPGVLAVPGKKRSVCIWDFQKAKPPRTFAKVPAPAYRLRYSPNGKYLVAVCINTPLVVMRASDGKTLYKLDVKPGFDDISFSPNSHLIAVIKDPGVFIWNLTTGKPIKREEKAKQPSKNY